MAPEPPQGLADSSSHDQRLSYKFQRLRERIRAAIASGELAGKLPGERELAKRFKVNTKTLSKALTDLAADGLVERNIGLGTFVRGESPREPIRALLIRGTHDDSCLDTRIDEAIAHLTVHVDSAELPGTLLARFDHIVVASDRITDEALRDMVVRGKRVITIGRRAATFATRSILIDEPNAAAGLAQRLARRGHDRLMILGYDADGEILSAVKAAAPDATVQVGQLTELGDALSDGVTGVIVTVAIHPRLVLQYIKQYGLAVPENVSVLSIGCANEEPPCSGLFVPITQMADALVKLLEQQASNRPVTVWLSGTFIDYGTLGGPPDSLPDAQ